MGEHIVGKNPDCKKGSNNNLCAAPVIKRKFSEIISHENYKAENADSQDDIALIRLDEAVPLYVDDPTISSAMPVCLPWKKTDPGRDIKDGDFYYYFLYLTNIFTVG